MITELWNGSSTTSQALRHVRIKKDSVSGRIFVFGVHFYDLEFSREISKRDIFWIVKSLLQEVAKEPAGSIMVGMFDFSMYDSVYVFEGLGAAVSVDPARNALYIFLKLLQDCFPIYCEYDVGKYDVSYYWDSSENFLLVASLSQELGLFDQ
jgi:hypothetical protein